MTSSVSLEDLVHALAGSILGAQNLVEKSQLANLGTFFDENQQPHALEFHLPSMSRSAGEGVLDKYRVPLLSLVPHSSLAISEAQIDLDVDIGGLQDTPAPVTGLPPVTQSPSTVSPKPTLMVNPGSGGIAKQTGNAARLTIKLVSTETTEGLARLLNDVVKGQGIIGTVDPKA
jgi:hypothetical protein